MKKLFCILMVTFAFSAPVALAQETLLEYVLTSCDSDISNYCDQVTPGNGRLLHCMAAHEDKISSACAIALYDAATLLDELANTIVYLAASCETDIETYCADTPMGEGRMLTCLESQAENLTETCAAAIDEVVVE